MLANSGPNRVTKWKYHEITLEALIGFIDDFNNTSCEKKQSVKVLVCFSCGRSVTFN